MVPAHRLFYEERYGPIPEGHQLDHLCRQPACVNPAHLEPVTQTENIRRGAGTKLTIDEARAIRASAERQQTLADRYGISQPHVSCIKRGGAWAEADEADEEALGAAA
jgi:hypothetical protein